MPCPHSLVGQSSSCSMCLGAVPRRVVFDPDTGSLTVDGSKVARRFELKSGPRPVRVVRGRRASRAAARDTLLPDEDPVDLSDGASAD